MNAPPTNNDIVPRFESFEEQILRAFPLLRHTILSSNPDQPDADDGSTAVRLPPPIALSPSAGAFTCRICLELASCPVVSVCNEQCTYCLPCFERYLGMRPASARDRCCVICLDVPVSRGRLYEDVLAASPMFSRIYRGIEVACPKDGCDWKGPLDQYRRHGASCARKTVLDSLRDKLDRMQAELDQTRNVRDEALVERDEARNERDRISTCLLIVRQTVLDPLRDKVIRTQAELKQTRNERDEALVERDEARNERDELDACLVDFADDITAEASNLANNSRRRIAQEILLSLHMIDAILEKYAGSELYNNLVAKYGLGTLLSHGYCPPFDDPPSDALTSATSSYPEALAKVAAELDKIRAELDQTRAERDELAETIQRMQEESKEKDDGDDEDEDEDEDDGDDADEDDDGDDGDDDDGDDGDDDYSTVTWEM